MAWTKDVGRRRQTEEEMAGFKVGLRVPLGVCWGGRHGYKDEVNKKLGTYLTMTWELGMDLIGQPREMLDSSLKCHSCWKLSLPPSLHLGWLITFRCVSTPLLVP